MRESIWAFMFTGNIKSASMYNSFFKLLPTCLYMKSCVFECEDFPKKIEHCKHATTFV